MSAGTDWVAWHRDYEDPASALSRRLRVVQDQLRLALPARHWEPVKVISLCSIDSGSLSGEQRLNRTLEPCGQ
jgi:hypothetical protein